MCSAVDRVFLIKSATITTVETFWGLVMTRRAAMNIQASEISSTKALLGLHEFQLLCAFGRPWEALHLNSFPKKRSAHSAGF